MRKNKILRMLISLLLCGALVTAGFSGTAEESSGSGGEEIQALKALGIIKNYGTDGYVPSYAITRGEVAVMVLNLMGMDSGVQVGVEQTEEWAAPAMEKVGQLGIMTDPAAEEIIYQDLLTVLVRVAGLEIPAQASGGYPVGYIAMAKQAGITDGMGSVDLTGQVSKATAARLFYRTALTDIAQQTAFGDEITYETEKGMTVLAKYRDIYEVEGRITANDTASLDSEEGAEDGTVYIDNLRYEQGKVNTDGMLGYQVEGFYQLDRENTRTLLYLSSSDRQTAVAVIQAEQLENFADNTYTYWTEDGDTRETRISPKADIIYNNKPAFDLTDELFVPREGRVELLATSGGTVDLVKITAYQTVVVQYYSQDSGMLYGKYSSDGIYFDTEDEEYQIALTDTEGKKVSPSSLKAMDIVTVSSSADGKYVQGILSRQTVSGMISQVNNSVGEKSIKIDGTEYELCGSYEQSGDTALRAGSNVKIYLDANGRVAAAELQTSALQAGYLSQTGLEDGIEQTLMLRIFTTGGDFAELQCADSVKVDGVRVKEAAAILFALRENNGGSDAQVIQYRTNTDGLVDEIDTPYFFSDAEGKDSLRLSTPSQSLAWKNNTKIFGNKMALNDSTVIMNVPKTGDISDEELYEIKKMSDFANDSSYTVEGYTTKDTYGAVQIVMMYDQASGAALDKTSAVAVVESVSEVYNNETGEILNQLTCFGNESGDFPVEKDVDISDIHSGDIIRFSTGAGKIKQLEKLYDYASGQKTGAADPSGTATLLGYVYYKDAPYIRVTTKNPMEEEVLDTDLSLYKADAFSIFVYDGTLQEPAVSAGNAGQILDYRYAGSDCSRVFIATRNNDPRTLIVIK